MQAVTRRHFTQGALAALLLFALAIAPSFARNPRGFPSVSGGGGATPQFNFANFASSPNTINLPGDGSGFVNNGIGLPSGAVGAHEAGAGWFKTQQNISGGFTTNFTLQIPSGITVPSVVGVAFVVQNSPNNGSPQGFFGVNFVGDANLNGYGLFDLASPPSGQFPCGNSIAIAITLSSQNLQAQDYKIGASPATVGLYLNGGTKGVLIPELDMGPFGMNLYNGNLKSGTIVYDAGNQTITLVLLDTVTLAQARFTWPLNITTAIGGNMAWVGFTGATGPDSNAVNTVQSWSFSTGINTRLATPTMSPAGGSFTSAQTVTIACPSGATCFYTTNGLTPTTASTQYTGPITVSANEYVQAIAVESSFTDSFVGTANYLINAPNTINFGSGFAGSSGLITTIGNAQLSGSVIDILVASSQAASGAFGTVGADWYVAPIPISTFNTTFVFQSNSGASQSGGGICFVIQNQNPPSSDAATFSGVTGGPFAVGGMGSGFGYSQQPSSSSGRDVNGFLTSVAVFLDIRNNTVGVVTNGALPTGGTSVSGITFDSGDPISVNVVYSGTTMTVNLKDLTTSATAGPFAFTENIQSVVGGSTAYVGFTSSMGFSGSSSVSTTQSINSWTM
jgi:hypothetical protein